jgi:hypothetical protein
MEFTIHYVYESTCNCYHNNISLLIIKTLKHKRLDWTLFFLLRGFNVWIFPNWYIQPLSVTEWWVILLQRCQHLIPLRRSTDPNVRQGPQNFTGHSVWHRCKIYRTGHYFTGPNDNTLTYINKVNYIFF